MEEQKLELQVTNLTLGELTTNALKIKEEVENKLENYKAENYDINSINKAKDDKAMLNRTAKKLNDERLRLEKEFMKPFDKFKTVVKEITDMITESSSKIDKIVKEVENKDKEDKKKAILVIFESEVKELKEALEKNDLDAIKSKKDALNETMQKLATKVYEEAAKNNQSADNANNTDSNSKDNVKDAEYEEK